MPTNKLPTNIQYKTRPYQDGDESGIIELLKISFSEWAKRKNPKEFWEWKYLDTPLGSEIVVAERDGKIIGVAHRINFNLKIGTNIRAYQLGDDFATHPNFRGEGIYGNLMKLIDDPRKKENKYLLSITSNPITIKDQINRGRILFPYPIQHLVKLKNIKKYLEEKEVKNRMVFEQGVFIVKNINKVMNIFLNNKKPETKIDIIDVNSFDDKIDNFWDEIKNSYDFILEKKQRYLNWRYGDPRSGEHKIKIATTSDKKILGYIVTELKTEKDSLEGYIKELLVHPDKMYVADLLLKESGSFFEKLNVNATNYKVVKGHPLITYFLRNGFIKVPQYSNMHVICDINQSNKDKDILTKAEPSKISFNYGDYL